ncbi:MAG: GerAB/ArcD/ProY family transporter [Desulfitobacteriia bacterium]
MIFPALYSARQLKKVSFTAFLVMGFIIFGVIIRDLLSLGPDLLTRLVFPPSLSTELTPELQLEPLISVNLLLGGWVKITICLYAAVVGIAQLLNLDDYKPLVFPLVLFTVVLARWLYDDIFKMLDWALNVYPYYALPLQVGIPLLILLIAKVRKL